MKQSAKRSYSVKPQRIILLSVNYDFLEGGPFTYARRRGRAFTGRWAVSQVPMQQPAASRTNIRAGQKAASLVLPFSRGSWDRSTTPPLSPGLAHGQLPEM